MDLSDIKKHWKSLAQTYNKDLLATTKTRTIKDLEIDALARAFRTAPLLNDKAGSILEVGCGNGHNCIALRTQFPELSFTGIDFVPEMIEGAKLLLSQEQLSNVIFQTGDILNLSNDSSLAASYNAVFTVRCIINLPSEALHQKALEELCSKVKVGGSLIIIENFTSSYGRQNELRKHIGLSERTPDSYNLFLNEDSFCEHAKKIGFNVQKTEDFASLHDVVLYVLLPSILEGKIEYDHPLMHSVTQMILASKGDLSNSFGSFGQNRLYHFIKVR